MIYAIEAIGLDAVKFGLGWSPVSRMAELQVGCPVDLRLIAQVDLPDHFERAIHRKYAPSRLRGEWFKKSEVEQFLSIMADAIACRSALEPYVKINQRQDKSGLVKFLSSRLGPNFERSVCETEEDRRIRRTMWSLING